ncbi:MAG TPA: adenylate/guanylate cyclase domain-containing protein [Anaerolineales bacterium]|nr:adenylate/guanylate cyclase domain-containing protein [Anaerolineales bacterium]
MEINPPEDRQSEDLATQAWRTYLTTGRMVKGMRQLWFEYPFLRPFFRVLPADPRCQICYIPFNGVGGFLSRQLLDVKPSQLNPHMCNYCEKFAERFLGGVEMEVSILFADIRNSSSLAEKLGNFEYSQLIHRFYNAATRPLYSKNALIEKFIGDGLTAFFVPAFAGPNHAQAAIEAGQGVLRATGHLQGQTPWIPVGVGVNTGIAYIGSMKMEGGRTDITILGEVVNTAARLCSQAGAGEILISHDTKLASGISFEGHEFRTLSLKGKQDPVDAWVWKSGSHKTS